MPNRENLIKRNSDLGLTPQLYNAMEEAGINIPLSLEWIRRANNGDFDRVPPIKAKKLPTTDDPRIFDPSTASLTLPLELAKERLNSFDLPHSPKPEDIPGVTRDGGFITLPPQALDHIGLLLAPVTAFGSLNGGSASSYLDRTRIKKAYPELLEIYKDILPECERISSGSPKGSTPAFWNPDGSPGYDFLALKARALLIRRLRWKKTTGIRENLPLYPMFEMTSHLTHTRLREAYKNYADSELLSPLCRETGWNPESILSAQQPLLAAMSPDKPYTIFNRAWARENSPLAMPGGHGHSFYVLRNIYRQMYSRGIRFAYLGNIDNSGLLVNDRALAWLALSGKQGCFDFSYKTEADVKGGILVEDENGRLNCGDIGLAISREEVAACERRNTPILFNTASGLFSLEWLIGSLDRIIRDLPTRLTRQEKDRGCYTQAEQVTWEVLGMMDDKLICMVNKYERFIAAKMVTEMLIASRIEPDRTAYPSFPATLKKIANNLQSGLTALLSGPYGLVPENGRWRPLSPDELKQTIL